MINQQTYDFPVSNRGGGFENEKKGNVLFWKKSNISGKSTVSNILVRYYFSKITVVATDQTGNIDQILALSLFFQKFDDRYDDSA